MNTNTVQTITPTQQKTTKRYPYTTASAAASINDYYSRTYGVNDAWVRGARGFNSGDKKPGQPVIAGTFIESPRTPGAWREIGYGNTDREIAGLDGAGGEA